MIRLYESTRVDRLRADKYYYMESISKYYTSEIITGYKLISLSTDNPFFSGVFRNWNFYELENEEELKKYSMAVELLR